MTNKRQEFLGKLAAVFELAPECVTPELEVGMNAAALWDSLNIMSAVVLIDEVYGRVVHGGALAKCSTVADILKVAEGE